MEIRESFYKDQFALALEFGSCRALVMPYEGGKMASLTYRMPSNEDGANACSVELLAQNPGEKYLHLAYDGSYIESECSAFDDMMPTIDPWNNGTREYADHGEVCRLPWKYERFSNVFGDCALHMSVESRFGDYLFEKWYNQSKNNTLTISYKVTNLTHRPLPMLWAAHMMLAAWEGAAVSIPDIKNNPAEIIFSKDNVLGEKGTLVQLDEHHPLLISEPFHEDGNSYKLYFQKAVQGPISYGNLAVTAYGAPYAGLWINNGSFKRMYNVAIEVCTGGFDTPGEAMRHCQDVILPAREERVWSIELEIKGAGV